LPGDADQSAELVEQVVRFADGDLLLVHDVDDDGRVDVAAAGAHHQPFQRRETHRGIHRFSPLNGGGAGAVTQVQRDQVGVTRLGLQDLAGAAGDVEVGGPVEAVAPDGVLLVERVRDGVDVGVLRHGGVEGGVEHADHGDIGQDGHRRFDAHDVGRVVQRSQLDVILEGLDHGVGDPHRTGERLAAVDHPVTDRLDLVQTLENAQLRLHQQADDRRDGHGVVQEFGLADDLLAAGTLHVDDGAHHAHPVRFTHGQVFLGGGVDELVLDRRAAAVQCENDHGCTPLRLGDPPPAFVVLEEALAGLQAELALADHLAQQRAGPVRGVAEVAVNGVEGIQHHVDPDLVGQRQRAERQVVAEVDGVVDVVGRGEALHEDLDRRVDHGQDDAGRDEARILVDFDGAFAQGIHQALGFMNHRFGGSDPLHDLHDDAGGDGEDEVQADEALGQAEVALDVGDRDGGGVGHEQGGIGADGLHLEEKIPLFLEGLSLSLDEDLGRLQILAVRRGFDALQDGLLVAGGQSPATDLAIDGELDAGDAAAEPALLIVAQDHVDLGVGDVLRDPLRHLAAPQHADGSDSHECLTGNESSKRCGRPGTRPALSGS